MRRVFFNLYDDMTVIDEEGVEVPSLETARNKAIATARDMACVEVREGHLNLTHRIEVADDSGDVLWTVRFGDVVKVNA